MGDDTRVPEILGVTITFFLLSTLTTALRLYLRLAILRNFGTDDWLIIAAVVFNTAYTALNLETAQHGWGRHVWTVGASDFEILLKSLYWAPTVSALTTGFVKLSILSLYRRLAQDRPHIRIIYGFSLFIVSYTVVLVLLGVFICTPISAAWDLNTYPGGCMKTSTLQTVQSAFNIATDALIFIMPLPLICRMTMPLHDKIIVVVVLAMGAIAVIASAFRIFFMNPGFTKNSLIRWYVQADGSSVADITWNAVNPGEWTLIESSLMITCASIFALRRLWVSRRRDRRQPPAESISGQPISSLPSRPMPAFLSRLHILQRKLNSGMEVSMFSLTSEDKTAGDGKTAEQSVVGTSTATGSKELVVSTPGCETSAV